MASVDGGDEAEASRNGTLTLSGLQEKHRKEQGVLQSRLTQKKKNATKKTRKGVNDECEALQRQLDEQQRAEVDALSDKVVTSNTAQLTLGNQPDSISGLTIESSQANGDGSHHVADWTDNDVGQDQAPDSVEDGKPRKANRQKARLARRAAEQQAQIAEAEKEAATLPNRRVLELEAMRQQMKQRKLSEISIRPDGHCLYSAVATQLPDQPPSTKPYQVIRESAGNYIASHPDDFQAFLEEPLESYVYKVKHTAEWGGQLELQAISQSLSLKINVLQADGSVESMSPDKEARQEIWLAYYRHSFGLGEHYNALRKAA